MSKQNANVPAARITGKEINQAVVLGGTKPEGLDQLSPEDVMAILETSDWDQDLSTDYFKFDQSTINKELIFLVTGFDITRMVNNGKETDVPVVKIENIVTKESFINGDKVFVGACRRGGEKLAQIPFFVKVKHTGEQKSGGGGSYKTFDIRTFAPTPR